MAAIRVQSGNVCTGIKEKKREMWE